MSFPASAVKQNLIKFFGGAVENKAFIELEPEQSCSPLYEKCRYCGTDLKEFIDTKADKGKANDIKNNTKRSWFSKVTRCFIGRK